LSLSKLGLGFLSLLGNLLSFSLGSSGFFGGLSGFFSGSSSIPNS